MSLRKGWCPTLTQPMQTGDGLLVRIHIQDGELQAAHARGIAQAAQRFGNGYIDLTSRGNLQIRGVTQGGYADLFAMLTEIGVEQTPRPDKANDTQEKPVLGLTADQLALGLPFGRLDCAQLLWLADIAAALDGIIHTTPWRILTLKNISQKNGAELLQEAQSAGFITDNSDARIYIQACPGAPACSSAQGDTRLLASELAKLNLQKTVHISGCSKGCAYAHEADITIVATPMGYDLGYHAKADGALAHRALITNSLITMLKS